VKWSAAAPWGMGWYWLYDGARKSCEVVFVGLTDDHRVAVFRLGRDDATPPGPADVPPGSRWYGPLEPPGPPPW
jgi:hypothetical protein